MHAKDDKRLVKIFEALSFSFGVLEYNYKTLYENCIKIPESNDYLIATLSACWSIIDSVHRIREISQVIPGLNNKNVSVKKFLSKTQNAETFRHYFQHLRTELAKKELDEFPVFGSLSWIDNKDESQCNTVLLGAKVSKLNHFSCPLNTKTNKWASKVCLSIGKLSFIVDVVFNESMVFKKMIMAWIKNTYGKEIIVKTKIPIVSFRLKVQKDDN